uniref:Translation initiation factor IF2/IF5 domain-containing protein n=1 Tax=Arundo donax TaxID=35708 RepID=A0A0A8YIS8_ARUDO
MPFSKTFYLFNYPKLTELSIPYKFIILDEYVICSGCKSPDTILSKENRLFFLRCEQVNCFLYLDMPKCVNIYLVRRMFVTGYHCLFYLEFISTFLALHTLFSQSKPCFVKHIEIGICPLSNSVERHNAPTGNIVSVSFAVSPTVLFWSDG